jgi:hypothetical protein
MIHFAAAATVLAVAVLLILALRVYCRLFGGRP